MPLIVTSKGRKTSKPRPAFPAAPPISDGPAKKSARRAGGPALRPIDGAPFRAVAALAAGAKPRLDYLDLAALRIDPDFQRELGREGEAHVRRIARAFDWRKFAPLIVAPIGEGLYSVIDGQHRASAAAACGFRSVPCAIYDCDPQEAADAFQAINSATHRLSSMQIFWAKVAAGDAAAMSVAQICRAAGVTLLRYPVAANNLKAGETIAAATILKLYGVHGAAALTASLTLLARHDEGGLLLAARWIVALTRALAALGLDEMDARGAFSRLDHHRLEGEAERLALADAKPVTAHLRALLEARLAR